MSYDLQIWATRDSDIQRALPEPDRWHHHDDFWVRSGRGWQIIIGRAHRIEPEDVPDGARDALPGVQHMIELSLEPVGAPRSALALLHRTAKIIAVAAHGAILDPQDGSITTPTGVRRYMKQAREEIVDALELSWFSMNDTLRTREWFDSFVSVLEHDLPEALPVRYGKYEPPPHRLRELGRDHLVEFLADEYLSPRDLGFGFVVWYPQRPILTLNLSFGTGASRMGWRAQRITLDVELAALRQPGWETALKRVWLRLAETAHVFFADARVLRNQRPKGTRAAERWEIDRHPVCSWFWSGLPTDGGVAAALGEPYLSLWPEFRRAGERDGELMFLSSTDWTRTQNVFDQIGGVPNALA